MISEEEQKVSVGGRNKALEGLKKMKREYDEQVRILEAAMEEGTDETKIAPEDVKALKKELLNMEIMGVSLKNILDGEEAGTRKVTKYSEYQLPQPNRRTEIKDKREKMPKKGKALIDQAKDNLNKLRDYIIGDE